jgi:hypothetical protein
MEPINPKYISQYYSVTDKTLRRILEREVLSSVSKQYIKELVRTADGNWIAITEYDILSDMPEVSND